PMARARWSALLAGSPRLHTAFSVESVADELCFVIGPAAATLLATQVHPAAGVTCAALCALCGSLWFAAQRSTEPPVTAVTRPAAVAPAACPGPSPEPSAQPSSGPRRWRAVAFGGGTRLASPSLVVLVPAYLFLGAMFVSIDLSTVAFATNVGHKALAGLILGTYAL